MMRIVETGDRKRPLVLLETEPGVFTVELDGKPCAADIRRVDARTLSILLDGRSYRVLLDTRGEDKAVAVDDRRIPFRIEDPRSLQSRKKTDAGGSGARPVVASMPGRIIRLLVEHGDSVEAHQGLIVVEAMKMQNELKAPKAGTVVRVAVEVGATVQAGAVLLVIE
jgi:biotin carboxyl carrier protein